VALAVLLDKLFRDERFGGADLYFYQKERYSIRVLRTTYILWEERWVFRRRRFGL